VQSGLGCSNVSDSDIGLGVQFFYNKSIIRWQKASCYTELQLVIQAWMRSMKNCWRCDAKEVEYI
jgi:hypothetical protein